MLFRLDTYLVNQTMIWAGMLQFRNNVKYTTIVVCAALLACAFPTLGIVTVIRSQPELFWPLSIAFGILDLLTAYLLFGVFRDGLRWNDHTFFRYVLFANAMRRNVRTLRCGMLMAVLFFFVPLNLLSGIAASNNDGSFWAVFLHGMSQTAVTIVPILAMLYVLCVIPFTDPDNAVRIMKKFGTK